MQVDASSSINEEEVECDVYPPRGSIGSFSLGRMIVTANLRSRIGTGVSKISIFKYSSRLQYDLGRNALAASDLASLLLDPPS